MPPNPRFHRVTNIRPLVARFEKLQPQTVLPNHEIPEDEKLLLAWAHITSEELQTLIAEGEAGQCKKHMDLWAEPTTAPDTEANAIRQRILSLRKNYPMAA